MSDQLSPRRSPLWYGRDRFIHGPERLRPARNLSPETPDWHFEQIDYDWCAEKVSQYCERRKRSFKRFLKNWFTGVQGKVSNIIMYAACQIAMDLAALQLSTRLQTKEEAERNRIFPMMENDNDAIVVFCLFVTIGAILAAIRYATGLVMLLLSQLYVTYEALLKCAVPVFFIAKKMWMAEHNFTFSENTEDWIAHYFWPILYFLIGIFPVVVSLWFIYCTCGLTLYFSGIDIHKTNDEEEPKKNNYKLLHNDEEIGNVNEKDSKKDLVFSSDQACFMI